MVNHHHSAHSRHAVKHHDAPQGVGIDAAAGIAKDGALEKATDFVDFGVET